MINLLIAIATLPFTSGAAALHAQPDAHQVRPGTISGAKLNPATIAEWEQLERARRAARELLARRDATSALRVLAPWRDRIKRDNLDGLKIYFDGLYRDFFQSYVILDDWRSATKIAQEEYDSLRASKPTSVQVHHVLRLATSLYLIGQKNQAWALCEMHTDLFNENFLSNNLKKYQDKPITQADLGDALLRASALAEGSDLSMYFYGKLIHERPNDADAYYLLAQSLPDDDLLSKKIHYTKAKELGDAEMKKKVDRALQDVEYGLKRRQRSDGGGAYSAAISIGG